MLDAWKSLRFSEETLQLELGLRLKIICSINTKNMQMNFQRGSPQYSLEREHSTEVRYEIAQNAPHTEKISQKWIIFEKKFSEAIPNQLYEYKTHASPLRPQCWSLMLHVSELGAQPSGSQIASDIGAMKSLSPQRSQFHDMQNKWI